MGEATTVPKVLVVPAASVDGLFSRPQFLLDAAALSSFRTMLAREGRFVEREWAEATDEVKQVVAYGLVRHRDQALCLRRTRKSNRRALRLRYTLLFGGHVDEADEAMPQPIEHCLRRELHEEFGLQVSRHSLLGVAADPTTPVGRLHLGVVFDVPIDTPEIAVEAAHDSGEFVNSRAKTYTFMGPDKIRQVAPSLDPWSMLFVNTVVAHQLLGASEPLHGSSELPLKWASGA